MATFSNTDTTSLVRLQALLPQLFQANPLSGRSYLRCSLTADIGLLVSMKDVQESLVIPAEKITILPNMSGAVMGLMSTREKVVCLINLPWMLGYRDAIGVLRTYHVIVVQLSEGVSEVGDQDPKLLGLAVHKIQGVSRIEDDQLQAVDPQLSLNLKPYVTGASWYEGSLIHILDPQSIPRADMFHND